MKRCFVIMPFSKEFDLVFIAISKALKKNGLNCVRADKKSELGLISQSIIREIVLSDMIICDITHSNPNVFYELGISHVLNKPTIILSQELMRGEKLPFDITHMLTIPYSTPISEDDGNSKSLISGISRFLKSSKELNHNPVSIALSSEKLELSNYFKHSFLHGYYETLNVSKMANEAWVVSSNLYWERLDSLFNIEILKERILKGLRRELVILPRSKENMDRKTNLLNRYIKDIPNIEEYLRILLIKESLPFYFKPTEITIYDANTPNVTAILLEPMAHEGFDIENDAEISKAITSGDNFKLKYYCLREGTFDIKLPKQTAELLSINFRKLWNTGCLKTNNESWII